MLVDYRNLNEETKEKYFYLHKIGKISCDIYCCISLLQLENKIIPCQKFYLSQQLLIHFNEAIKFLKKFNESIELNTYIDNSFKQTIDYQIILSEMDFDNTNTKNNTYIKNFRDNSVHYKENKQNIINENEKEIEVFYKYASEFKSHFPKIEEGFSKDLNFEEKSMILHLTYNIIEKNITIEEFVKNISSLSISLIRFLKQLERNLMEELEGTH